MNWDRTERSLGEMKRAVGQSTTPEQCQVVGQLGRDTLISLAQAVFVSTRDWRESGSLPSPTDSKRMLEAYCATAAAGGSASELRAFALAAIRLADALAHKRTATATDARTVALAVECAVGIVAELDAHVLVGSTSSWGGLHVGHRYFAWDGPTLHSLPDRAPIPAPREALTALGSVGKVSFGRHDRLRDQQAKGLFQVFETDRATWRRELLYSDDAGQVLLILPSGAA